MERKVVVVHCHSQEGMHLQEKVSAVVVSQEKGGWMVVSATTSVSTCLTHSQHIFVQWVTTIVFEKE